MTRICRPGPDVQPAERPRRRPGRPPAHRRAAARQDLVDAAAALFARHGFRATTTAEIAARAGTSEGTLFHHFPTKRDLLAELGRREGERVLAVAFSGIDPEAPPPDPSILLRRLFDYARREPDAYRLFAMDGDVEDLASGFSAKRGRVVEGLAAVLAAWSARGHLRTMNPDLVAELIFAVTDAGVRRLVLGDRWSEAEECLAETSAAVRALLGQDATDAERRDRARGAHST